MNIFINRQFSCLNELWKIFSFQNCWKRLWTFYIVPTPEYTESCHRCSTSHVVSIWVILKNTFSLQFLAASIKKRESWDGSRIINSNLFRKQVIKMSEVDGRIWNLSAGGAVIEVHSSYPETFTFRETSKTSKDQIQHIFR